MTVTELSKNVSSLLDKESTQLSKKSEPTKTIKKKTESESEETPKKLSKEPEKKKQRGRPRKGDKVSDFDSEIGIYFI